MIIVSYKKVFFAIAAALVIGAFGLLGTLGLIFGTDFTGGALVEVKYSGERPETAALQESVVAAGLEGVSIRGAGDDAYIIRAAPLSPEARENLLGAISPAGSSGTVERLTDVGPSIGSELRYKALIALMLVVIGIVLYVAFAFRKVSEPVSSWTYGFITIVTLIFDVSIPLGAFAFFGYLWGAQVDTLFVTAILTVLGYSVHDTIVVFDRVRENLRLNQESRRKEDFELVAGRSIEQTFVRSVNTSITTLISLGALFFLGPVATQDFALTLIVGILAGTYSSVALATPLLVAAAERAHAKK